MPTHTPNITPQKQWFVRLDYDIPQERWEAFDRAIDKWVLAHSGPAVTTETTGAGPCWNAYLLITTTTEKAALHHAASFVRLVLRYHGEFYE